MRHFWVEKVLLSRRHSRVGVLEVRHCKCDQARQSHWIHAEEIEQCSRLIDGLDIGALVAECPPVLTVQGALAVLRRRGDLRRSLRTRQTCFQLAAGGEAFVEAIGQESICSDPAGIDGGACRKGRCFWVGGNLRTESS